MKILRFFLIVLLWEMASHCIAQTNNILPLSIIRMSIEKGDTEKARKYLKEIKESCLSSTNWEDKSNYYLYQGLLEWRNPLNINSAVDNFKKAVEAFPETESPSPAYLAATLSLCNSCKLAKRYEEGEKYAAKALFRASFLADSCMHAANLFSLLADFYEFRGDTIMPKHFHRKSQVLSIRYKFASEHPDSVEIYNDRLLIKLRMLDGERKYFGKNNYNYLFLLNDYLRWIGDADNIFEVKYVGEQILELANAYDLGDSENIFDTYYSLVMAYAAIDGKERAEEFMPKAVWYYSKFPQNNLDEYALYFYLGMGLEMHGDYKESIYFLQKSKKGLRGEVLEQFTPIINKTIELCKGKL